MKAIIQAFIFVFFIILGYLLKRLHIINHQQTSTLGWIVTNITLPCALFTTTLNITLSFLFLFLALLGVITNLLMVALGYFLSSKEESLIKGLYILNVSGYNLGNFILPFMTIFYPNIGPLYLNTFNIGSTITGVGMTYALAKNIVSHQKISIRSLITSLLKCISFDAYVLVIVFAILHITLPTFIITPLSYLGKINGYLAMFVLGLMSEFHFESKDMKQIKDIMIYRLIGAFVFTFITYLLPLPLVCQQVLSFAYFSPILSVSSIYSKNIGYHGNVSTFASSATILLSFISIFILYILYFVI